jgi:outer membrane protein assembly factor BamD (BamD/ComL family)
MDDIFNFKKFFIWVGVIFAIFWGITTYVSLDDCLTYAAKNPHKPSSEKIAYYVGAVHYHKSRFPEAIAAYDQVLTDFPTGQYAPKALFRKGYSHKEIRQWSQAREAYMKYMKDYPDSKHFKLAEKRYEYVKFK